MSLQHIYVNNDRMEPHRIYAGTRGSYITDVSFSFSGVWEGLTKKLIFYPVRGTPVYTVYTHGEVRIPARVMRNAGISLMLISGYTVTEDGKIGKKIITASASVVVNSAESDTRNEPDIPEATVFEEIVEKLGAPYIGESGNWYVWDVDTHEFVDTGLPARGEKGETGHGLTILGKYASLDELRANIAEPKPGAAYAVGEKAPYPIYIWDEVAGDFTYHGSIRGEGIAKIEQITDNRGSGEANIILITTDEGEEYRFTVYNGERGLPGNIWIGETEPPDDSYTIWLNPRGAVSGFVESYQTPANAGRALVVGEDGVVRPGDYAGGGTGGITQETDPTVPAWAKRPNKPTYTSSEIGAQPAGDYALRNEIPAVPVQSVNGKTGAVQLTAGDVGARPSSWMPSASDVGALPASTKIPAKTSDLQNDSGFVTAAVASLLNYYLKTETYAKGETYSQTELDALISGLDRRISAIADSDDTTLDQLSEIVAYIKANKSLIDSITTSKVSVADIVDNLTTSVANKPLSAAQGVALKKLIDALGTGKLDAAELPEAVNTALAQAKESGEFDGAPGKNGTSATHSWNGTTLTITSASGTSSADLKGEKGEPGKSGVYVGSDPIPEGYNVQIDPDGESVELVTMEDINRLINSDTYKQSIADLVVAHLVGQPVVGVVDSDKHIILNGTLPVGAYTLSYEGDNGEYSEIVELTITEEDKVAYTNVLPLAQEYASTAPYVGSDGSVGYGNNKRISSSSASTTYMKDQTGVDSAALIPVKRGDVLRFKNCNFKVTPSNTSYGTQILGYDSTKAVVSAFGVTYNNITNRLSCVVEGDEYVQITLEPMENWTSSNIDDVAYIMISTDGLDETSIITINQEIV